MTSDFSGVWNTIFIIFNLVFVVVVVFLYVSFIIFGASGSSTLLTANFMPRDFF